VSTATTFSGPRLAVGRRLAWRLDAAALGAWTLGFAPVMYLALRDGGYDTIVRSEVGLAVWWIVLLGALAGILPARIGRAGWLAIGLLAGFVVWTGIATGWSTSPGDTITELGRDAAYLGFLVLAVSVQGRTAGRHTVYGLAFAFGLVTALAVLSRLHPTWFPANAQVQAFGTHAARRLSYPLNYWNALAAFAAMGVPLLAAVALGARTTVVRALAAAVLPLSVFCIYLTVSRGGVLELGVATVVLVALVPRRLQALGTLLAGAAGGAILVVRAGDTPPLRSGLQTPAALHQGSAALTLAIGVCAGVALLQAAMATAEINLSAPRWALAGRRATARRALAVALVAAIAAVALSLPGRVVHVWNQFTAPAGVVVPANQSTVFSRLSALNGNGRYQYWQAALHAAGSRPASGVGPGTYPYWWAQHATTDGAVINAHSLYFETLAEAGIVGLTFIAALFILFLGTALKRSVSPRTSHPARIWIAGAAASLATFVVAAAFEWVWQLAALAAAALLLGSVLLSGRDDETPLREQVASPARTIPRVVLVTASAIALIFISIPLATAVEIERSQNAVIVGDLVSAYRDSLSAERLEPYAVAPRLQEALVLEAAGDLRAAAAAARVATERAPTDWQAWLTLARIDARLGANRAGIVALRRAEVLDPRNSLWEGQLRINGGGQ
jgi:hypothetical protein